MQFVSTVIVFSIAPGNPWLVAGVLRMGRRGLHACVASGVAWVLGHNARAVAGRYGVGCGASVCTVAPCAPCPACAG